MERSVLDNARNEFAMLLATMTAASHLWAEQPTPRVGGAKTVDTGGNPCGTPV